MVKQIPVEYRYAPLLRHQRSTTQINVRMIPQLLQRRYQICIFRRWALKSYLGAKIRLSFKTDQCLQTREYEKVELDNNTSFRQKCSHLNLFSSSKSYASKVSTLRWLITSHAVKCSERFKPVAKLLFSMRRHSTNVGSAAATTFKNNRGTSK